MNDKLFKEWAKTHKYNTNIEEGVYTNTHTQSAWEAWQASKSKPLTDEEAMDIWLHLAINYDSGSFATFFVREIEKRHGIK